MRPLSVIITTFNEADNLPRALASVAWADDILVVDSFSTDGTPDIARAHGARLLQRTYTGPADQKNWAIPQAAHEWILLLDADEAATPALRIDIQQFLAADTIPFDAAWIGRNNHFLGQRIRYSGWQGDAVIRFFHRDKARYREVQVHEEIATEGLIVSRLQGRLEHFTYRSLDHFLDKMRRYARWSAQDHAARTPRVTFFHLYLKPAFRFFKHYILQQGFRDGKAGLVVSAIMAWGVFLRYAYLLEERNGEIVHSCLPARRSQAGRDRYDCTDFR
ncbi:MAG: glycosyltransferase family 2 protein [Lewinella sp.]|nr:glycosyltransferase family 2 protein [Lewinella sp.]